MGKKGKNKNQTANVQQNTPKTESESINKEEKVQEAVPEIPKVEQLKIETEVVENSTEDGNESKKGTLKSKKRRNRNKKNPATDVNIEESKEEKPENVDQKEKQLVTPGQEKSEPAEDKPSTDLSTDTLKKKRRRNRKKNTANVEVDAQEENAKEVLKNESSGDNNSEKLGEASNSSQQNTLKRKRNRNKNKTTVNNNQDEAIVEVVEKPIEKEQPQNVEASCEQKEKPEPQKRGKKQKRFDLSSKKTILDELQDRQEREQKGARDHIKNEIAKREKLLETIDLVLDCHKTEAELAKSTQESLKDVKLLSQEAAKPRPQTSSKPPKQSSSKKSTPVEDELVNKIEQVLGMTKLEIQNAQTQKAYVNRLEAEVAKVKQSKDILLGGQSSSVVPPHIQKMAKEMRDLTKGEVPKTKEELIKEIESRDALMSEINKVLDNTKSEIDKVQKQQKIIQNLEVELKKMKEQEVVEKLMVLAEEELPQEPPPPPKQSAATASLLDALMANVGKLKEMQALKEKQKAEESAVEVPVEVQKITQETSEGSQPIAKLDDVITKVESNDEAVVNTQKQETEKPKSPKKDAKRINNEKKQASLDESPKEQKKQPKDQKQQPQKVNEKNSKAEDVISSDNKEDKISTKIEDSKKVSSVELKKELTEVSEKIAVVETPEIKPKTENVKLEPTKPEKQESPKKEQKKKDLNKDKGKNEKAVNNSENKATNETNVTQEKAAPEQEKNKVQKAEDKCKETTVPNQEKEKQVDPKIEENVKEVKDILPVEVKPITSSEPIPQEIVKNESKGTDQKKTDKGQKTSPRNSHKNKNHKHEKKDVIKGVPEVIPPVPVAAQKPSMAEMLKSAPDPPPEEISKIQNEELKVEGAPLARPESAIIEVKPSEQIKELIQSTMVEPKDLVVDDTAKTSSEVPDSELVIVNKEEIEAEIKEEKLNEQDLTDPKNVQRGGFVSPAEDNKDTKPLKKDEKLHANKNKSPGKTPTRPNIQKGSDAQSKNPAPKPKLEVQAKVNSKPIDAKKTSQSPTKPLSPSTEKPQPKFESATKASTDAPTSLKHETQNSPHDNLPSTDKSKVPPRPDVTKTSNTKPAPRAGNVTNQPSSPKPKTPSPSVSKPATTGTAQSQSNAAKPKPTVSQTRQSATSKTPINTKSTNQKPLATPQKVNSTKPTTPKPASSTASATETK